MNGDNSIVKLDAAMAALDKATTLEEVKQIMNIAEAARVYARKAKRTLEVQNHAAELKLRAERKAGGFLAKLKRHKKGRPKIEQPAQFLSEYESVLQESDIARRTAERWITEWLLSEEDFDGYIATVYATPDAELLSAALLKNISDERRAEREAKRDQRRQVNAVKAAATPDLLAAGACFPTILVDPPWDWGDEGDVNQMGRAKPDYATLSLEQLLSLPVGKLADPDAHLYLWITNRSLPKGFSLLECWGFRYVTCLTWVKPHYGMGNYFRGQTEHILFGVKGSQPLKRHDVGTVFHAERGPNRHSSKPSMIYDLIESCSPGPYLELFSRVNRSEWSAWGADAA